MVTLMRSVRNENSRTRWLFIPARNGCLRNIKNADLFELPQIPYLRITIDKTMFKRLPRFSKNFYFLAIFAFLVWMLFVDSNDLLSRFKLSRRLHTLEGEKEYYQQKIKEVEKDREELMTNKELLEKFAREKYLMKKETEDVFIIQTKD